MPKCNYCKQEIEWPQPYRKGQRPLEPGTDRQHACPPGTDETTPGIKQFEDGLEDEVVYTEENTVIANDKTAVTFEPADQTLKHDFSFRSLEVTIGKTRKVSNATMPEIPQFENMEFSVYQKFQVDYTTDIPRLMTETWAKMSLQIAREIEAERKRLK